MEVGEIFLEDHSAVIFDGTSWRVEKRDQIAKARRRKRRVQINWLMRALFEIAPKLFDGACVVEDGLDIDQVQNAAG